MRMMTVLLLSVLVVSGFLFADSLSFKIGENIFRISEGSEFSDKTTIRELQKRVWMLERAVVQLQNQAFPVPVGIAQPTPVKTFSCYLQTPFKGTFTGTGRSIIEAKGKALKACTDGGGSIHCDDDKVKCDSAD